MNTFCVYNRQKGIMLQLNNVTVSDTASKIEGYTSKLSVELGICRRPFTHHKHGNRFAPLAHARNAKSMCNRRRDWPMVCYL